MAILRVRSGDRIIIPKVIRECPLERSIDNLEIENVVGGQEAINLIRQSETECSETTITTETTTSTAPSNSLMLETTTFQRNSVNFSHSMSPTAPVVTASPIPVRVTPMPIRPMNGGDPINNRKLLTLVPNPTYIPPPNANELHPRSDILGHPRLFMPSLPTITFHCQLPPRTSS